MAGRAPEDTSATRCWRKRIGRAFVTNALRSPTLNKPVSDVMAIRFPRITAARRQAALADAEKEFARSDKTRGKAKHVSIRTSQIKERLELF